MKIKKNDTVLIISGKDRSRKGKVIEAFPAKGKVIVEGMNIRKKHVKPKKSGAKGQLIESPGLISVSNVKIICPKCGDVGFGVYCRDCGSKTKRVMERDIYIDYNQLDEKSVWLPTQSQLQEMLGGSWIETFEEFGWFVNDNSCDEWSFDNKLNYGSMEQLWLAFVMKSCYNKEWVNGQWEKIDE